MNMHSCSGFQIYFNLFYSFTMKYIDEAIEKIEMEKKLGNRDANRETSILEKLYSVDRNVAIIMALDLLLAGVDTVRSYTEFTKRKR